MDLVELTATLVVSEELADRLGFEPVAHRRRGAVRVDVGDLGRSQTGIADRVSHHAERAFVLGRRRGDVEGIAADAVADDLRDDLARRAPRSSSLREPGCPRLRP